MDIRIIQPDDYASVKNVYLESFDKNEAQTVADLAIQLSDNLQQTGTLSFVASDKDNIIGHISFSPVFLQGSGEHFAYILAPLAVVPGFQKKGIGSLLVKTGLDSISKKGSYIVFVYGDPDYYHRFGFETDSAKKFTPPSALSYPGGWQALTPGSDILPTTGTIKCVDVLNDPDLW